MVSDNISDTTPFSSNVSSHIVLNNDDEQESREDLVEVAAQNKDGGNVSY